MIWVHLLLFLSFSDFKISLAGADNELPFASLSTYSPPIDGENRHQEELCPVKDFPNNIHFSNKCDIPDNDGVSTENQQFYHQRNNNINPNGNPVQMFPRQGRVHGISNAAANFGPNSYDFSNSKNTESAPDLNIKGSLIPFADNEEIGLRNNMPFKPNFQILKSDIDVMPFNNPSNIFLRNDCGSNMDKKCSIGPINNYPAKNSQDFQTPDLSIKGNLIPVSSNKEMDCPLLHMSNVKPDFQILKSNFNILPNKPSSCFCNKPCLNHFSRESSIPPPIKNIIPPLKNKISNSYPVSSGTEFKVPISVTCTTFSPKTMPPLNREKPTEKFSVTEGCNNFKTATKPSFQIDNSCLCRDSCSPNHKRLDEQSTDLSIKGQLFPISSSSDLQNSCFSSRLSNMKPDFQILNSNIDVIPPKKSSSMSCINIPQPRFSPSPQFNNRVSTSCSTTSFNKPQFRSSSSPQFNNRVSPSYSTSSGTDFKVPISLTCCKITPKTDDMPSIIGKSPAKSCLSNCNKPYHTGNCDSLEISTPKNIIDTQNPMRIQSSQKDCFINEKCNMNEGNNLKNSRPKSPYIIDCTHFLNNIPDPETITASKYSPKTVSNTITPILKTPTAVTESITEPQVYIPQDNNKCNNISPNIFVNQQITDNIKNSKPCIENEKPVFRRPLEISFIKSEPVNIPEPFTPIIDNLNIIKPDVNQCSLGKDIIPETTLLDFNPTISTSQPISLTPLFIEPAFIPKTEINSCISPVNQIVDNHVKIDNIASIKVGPPIVPVNAFPNIYGNHNNIVNQNMNPIPSSLTFDNHPNDGIYNFNSQTPTGFNSYFTNDISLNPVKVPITIKIIPSNDVQENFDVYENQYPSYQYKTQELPEVCVNEYSDYLPVGSVNYVQPLTSYNSNYMLPVVKILPSVSYTLPSLTVFKTSSLSNDCINNDFTSKINGLVTQILSQRSQRLKTNKITCKPDSECMSTMNSFSPDSAKPLIIPISSYIENKPIQYLPECNVPTKSFDFPSLPSTIAPSTPNFSSCTSLQKLLQVIALSELINSDSSTNWAQLGTLLYAACN